MLKDLVNRSLGLPKGSKLLIFGGGFSGQHVAALIRAQGGNVVCTRREIKKPGADCVFNSLTKEIPSKYFLKNATHILSCIPPDPNGGDPVLMNLMEELQDLPLQWVGYLSTTGVYGDTKGKWVSEEDPPNPTQPRSKRRLNCEKAWQSSGLPVQIIRLPGIYGPGRSALTAIKSGKGRIIDKPGQVFSRIHVDDIAGALLHLINLANQGEKPKIINFADNMPTANKEVQSFAAELLGIPMPPIEQFELASQNMSPMALSFWQENRRISNKMLCEVLKYKLIHPDYRSGLKDCLMNYK